MKKIDERDTMFSRMGLNKNSKEYNNYYLKNPKKKKIDEKLRKNPGLCDENSNLYNVFKSKAIISGFKYLSDIKELKNKSISKNKIDISRDKITKIIKELVCFFGADIVGITKLSEKMIYSHRGRDIDYGKEINLNHKYAIVFGVEMNENMIKRAPFPEETMEVTKGYIKAATIGMWLSYYINELGYESFNHMDGHYLINLPITAYHAGLGQIGRNTLLINPKYGSRIRLGAVSTNLNLLEDNTIDFNLNEFCNKCMRCFSSCPVKAISDNKLNDSHIISFNQEKCYENWSKLGTDCGICINSCPFSHQIDENKIKKLKNGEFEVIDEILSIIKYRQYEKNKNLDF